MEQGLFQFKNQATDLDSVFSAATYLWCYNQVQCQHHPNTKERAPWSVSNAQIHLASPILSEHALTLGRRSLASLGNSLIQQLVGMDPERLTPRVATRRFLADA